MRFKTLFMCSVMCAAWVGCGSDDEKPKGGSLAAVMDSIEHPTGTLTSENATDVAKAYEEAQSSGLGAGSVRQSGTSAATDVPNLCTSGSASYSQAGKNGIKFTYSDCCVASSCCIDGSGNTYVNTEAGATYSACFEYDITETCDGQDISINYSGCQGANGMTFAVSVAGETFAVSGSYSSTGGGTLTITGENGTFTCTYAADGTGSCTGDGELSF